MNCALVGPRARRSASPLVPRVGAGLALLLVGAVAVAARAATPATAPSIRIGVSLGLSGTYAAIANMYDKAYRLWERRVNERGGILGRPVQMIIRDDKSDPQVARQIYEDFIQNQRVDFVFGPYSSVNTLAIAPLVEQHGHPMLAVGAAGEEIWKRGYQNILGMAPPAGRYTVGFLAVLASAGIQRVAIVSVDDVFSLGVAEGTKRWVPQYELRVTLFRVEPKANPDFPAAAEDARRSGAQALLVAGHFQEAVLMRQALKRIGWSPAAYYATIGPALQEYFDRLGPDAQGTFSSSPWEPREGVRSPKESAEFLRDFVAMHGEAPSYHAAIAYSAGQILQEAIVRSGSIDRAAVRRALFSLTFESISGRYAVDGTGLRVQEAPMIVQWQGKRREVVWPAESRTAAPVVNK